MCDKTECDAECFRNAVIAEANTDFELLMAGRAVKRGEPNREPTEEESAAWQLGVEMGLRGALTVLVRGGAVKPRALAILLCGDPE